MNNVLQWIPRRSLLATALFFTLTACGGDSSTEDLPGAGSWRVINYWAVWCTPCRQEIPELNAIHKKPGVTVLGVNFDNRQGDDLASDIEDLGIEFVVLREDPAPLLGTARPSVLPTTFIVDPNGELRRTLVGPQTEADLDAAIAGTP